MPQRVLVLSCNDQWHPLQELGEQVVAWCDRLPGVEATASHDLAALTPAALAPCRVCVLCATMRGLTAASQQALAGFVEQGGALVAIHSASVMDDDSLVYRDLLGARFVRHNPFGEFAVEVTDAEHPITRGLAGFGIRDELYLLDRAPAGARVLATAVGEGQPQPMLYVKPVGRGWVHYNALGHNGEAYANAAFRGLVLQGLAWACGVRPVRLRTAIARQADGPHPSGVGPGPDPQERGRRGLTP